MNNERFHPILSEPPIAHALHKWDEKNKQLCYMYNGKDIITVDLPDAEDVGFRHGSDGSIQSVQYMQQIYIAVERPMEVVLTFTLGEDAINMKPHRASGNEAILGQCGNILIDGVNGLYDVREDLLIDFHGCPWSWCENHFHALEDGRREAKIRVTLSEKPLFINLRMHYYNRHLGYNYHKPWVFRPKEKPVAGWCSWEAYRRAVDQGKIEQIAQFMGKHLRDYGLEYIQVDDGYQKMPLPYDPTVSMAEGWLRTEEEKFPEGHEGIVAAIKAEGLSPGIWTNANITHPDFPDHHPEDVLWYEGKPLVGEWIDYLYSCKEETLAHHVEPLFRALTQEGYEYVKIDAIRHLLYDGLHEAVRLGIMSNEEAEGRFRAYMEATRRGLGDEAFYLASWGELHEVIGLADACRIAMDANPTWAGVRMQLFESARWFHTQRILFQMDPDHVCVRTKAEWAKSVLSLISLSGGLYMLSDTPEAYDEEKLAIIRKTLPPLPTRTAETGPLSLDYPAYAWTKLHGFAVQSNERPVGTEDVSLKDALDMAGIFPTMTDEHPFSSLWAFHLSGVGRSWCVVGRFATMPLVASKLPLEKLGLDPFKRYLAFDFWKQRYLGSVSAYLEGEVLEIGACQIVALHELKDTPQLIGSTRHVSMDAVSVKGYEWDQLHTRLVMKLEGVIGSKETYTFHIPEHYQLKGVVCESDSMLQWGEEVVGLEITFGMKEVDVMLVFDKKEV